MRIPDLERDELLAFVLGVFRDGGVFDARAVADADEAQDRGVAFTDAEDVVAEVLAGRTWEVDQIGCRRLSCVQLNRCTYPT